MRNRLTVTELDSRYVFLGYAWLAGIIGLAILAWGPLWFGIEIGHQPFAGAALIRVFGSFIMAAACASAALAAVEDPAVRRRASGWFALAHVIVGFTVSVQAITVAPSFLTNWAVNLTLVPMGVFAILWRQPGGYQDNFRLQGLFNGDPKAENLRSRYEDRIREAASQEERHRLARDLHDSVKQQLFVIQTAAATAQTRFDGDSGGAREAIEQVRGAAREAIAEMQAMLDQLRAAPLENTGLVAALRKQCDALGFRTGAKVDFEAGPMPSNELVPPGTQQAIFRVAQEALANVARHARAHHVKVTLRALIGQLTLEITDDGQGFDTNRQSEGMGISSMRARALEYGGTLEIQSAPGSGATVRVTLPYDQIRMAPYGRNAAIWALVMILILAVMAVKGIGSGPWIIAFSAVECARNVVAYRRTRKLSGVKV